MIFVHPEHLVYFVIPMITLGIYITYRILRKKDLQALGEETLLKKMFTHVDDKRRHIKFALVFLSLVFAVLALMQPKWGKELVKIKERGAEIVFILDNSLSMLAEDVFDENVGYNRKEVSRFHRAKAIMIKMAEILKGNKLSLILAARKPQIECPLTFNYELLSQAYIKEAKIAPPYRQGTRLANAIENAFSLYSEGNVFPKIIILVSDGEDHRSRIKEVLKKVKDKGITIFTVGIGSEEGAYIPLRNMGYFTGRYKRYRGQKVLSVLQEKTLRYIADNSFGVYYHIRSGKDLQKLYERIGLFNQGKFRNSRLLMLKDRFQLFMLAALICLALGLFVPETRGQLKVLFDAKKIAFLFLVFMITTGFTQDVKKGNEYYKSKQYKKAIEEYNRAIEENPEDYYAHLYRGNSYYKKNDLKKALRDYKNGLNLVENPKSKSDFYYNMGRTAYQMGDRARALKWYRKSLKENPDHRKARYNYYLLKKLLKEENARESSSKGGSMASPNRKGNTDKNYLDAPPNARRDQESDVMDRLKGLFDKRESLGRDESTSPSERPGAPSGKGEMDKKLERLFRRDQENRSQLNPPTNGDYERYFNEDKDW
ncbi:MAG: aerotolerance regulator BatB [bacterium]|nr:MAG: aerotolerance regulator BatB [bacterium]